MSLYWSRLYVEVSDTQPCMLIGFWSSDAKRFYVKKNTCHFSVKKTVEANSKNVHLAGCITRDTRRVERKKPGHVKARKMPAWVKRWDHFVGVIICTLPQFSDCARKRDLGTNGRLAVLGISEDHSRSIAFIKIETWLVEPTSMQGTESANDRHINNSTPHNWIASYLDWYDCTQLLSSLLSPTKMWGSTVIAINVNIVDALFRHYPAD
jgi:hypothetical protein